MIRRPASVSHAQFHAAVAALGLTHEHLISLYIENGQVTAVYATLEAGGIFVAAEGGMWTRSEIYDIQDSEVRP